MRMDDISTFIFPDNIGRYDIHSHIIPGVDDGARDIDESIELIETAYNQGIRIIYATPHYSRRSSNMEIRDIFAKLQAELQKRKPNTDMKLILGHELVYHSELAERLKSGEAFTMGESNKVLIEFSPMTEYRDMYRQLRELIQAGYVPIVAHMERYDALMDPDNVAELKHNGCLIQMNYSSLTGDGVTGIKAPFGGRFSREVKRCRRLVQSGYIDLFGTDMHRRDFRPPDTEDAVRWLKNNTEGT